MGLISSIPENNSIQAIILAAGRSTRFHTDRSKLLTPLCGREIIAYVTQSLSHLHIPTTLIIGYQGNLVKECVENYHGKDSFSFITQEKQNGTGHAVLCSQQHWSEDHILVMNGDMPLVSENVITDLCNTHIQKNATVSLVVAYHPENTGGYGRIVEHGNSIKIVEAKEFSGNTSDYPYINAGIYLFKRTFLEQFIKKLHVNAISKELYITDMIGIAAQHNELICTTAAPIETICGINTLKELADAEQVKRTEIIERWMNNGVRFFMPDLVHIDANVQIGKNTVIEGPAYLKGNTIIGEHCQIKAFSSISDSIIHDMATIKSHSVIENAHVHSNATVGPFAHIHTNTTIGAHATIGNFIETKKVTFGSFSKAKHLSYLGDAIIGNHVNIGAGTITCNYDGKNKHTTTIKDNAFIGTNNALIAPVTVGENAFTAAGSTIHNDVPDNALAIARARQINKEEYAPTLKKETVAPTEMLKKDLLKKESNI